METYIDEELEISIEIENNWHVVNDKEVMKEHLGMKEDELSNTVFILLKVENDKFTAFATVTLDLLLYETDAAYQDGLSANVQAVLDEGSKEHERNKTLTRAGARLDHITFKDGEKDFMSQYFVHINDLLVCFSINVKSPGNNHDRDIMNMVMSIKTVT